MLHTRDLPDYSCYLELNRLVNLLKFIMLGLVLSNCTFKPAIDFDKQGAFLTKFTSGMSKQEVDMIIQEHQDVTLLSEEFQENGELIIRYSTPGNVYGTNVFSFWFSADMKLIYVIPKNPTD